MSGKTWMQEEKNKNEKKIGISEKTCTQGERQKWMKQKKKRVGWKMKEKKSADIELNSPFLKLFVTPKMMPKMYIFKKLIVSKHWVRTLS